jgi:transcriptional regulator with XRE-family HTH domain
MNFGRAIRTARAARHLTQKALATKSGLDPSYISLLEANERQPSTETLANIAESLQVPVYLLVLLASDRQDLKGISPTEAKALAKQLLSLLTASEESKS